MHNDGLEGVLCSSYGGWKRGRGNWREIFDNRLHVGATSAVKSHNREGSSKENIKISECSHVGVAHIESWLANDHENLGHFHYWSYMYTVHVVQKTIQPLKIIHFLTFTFLSKDCGPHFGEMFNIASDHTCTLGHTQMQLEVHDIFVQYGSINLWPIVTSLESVCIKCM